MSASDASLRALQQRIENISREQELRARVSRLRQKLVEAEAQLRAEALEDIDNAEVSEPVDGDLTIDASSVDDADSDDDDADDDEHLDPIWDGRDNCFRCVECAGEVVDGECQFCYAQHVDPVDETIDDIHRGDDCAYLPLSSDRARKERGYTPILEGFDTIVAPSTFFGGNDAYRTLLRRGATAEMIKEFRMEWDSRKGILASATEELYDMWAGPAIRRGDVWKIALGRRVVLEPEDTDGWHFVNELLDDCFYPSGLTVKYWETVEERPGIWVTRPKKLRGDAIENPPQPDLDSDGPIKHRDEYEDDSGIDDDMADGTDWFEVLVGSASAGDPDSQDDPDYTNSRDEDKPNSSTMLVEDTDEMDCDSASGSQTTDSDQPGSDWDSQEELSGDEEAKAFRPFSIPWPGQTYPQPGPL